MRKVQQQKNTPQNGYAYRLRWLAMVPFHWMLVLLLAGLIFVLLYFF